MTDLKDVRLSDAERAELAARVRDALAGAGLDAVLLTGGANLAWASGGIVFPWLDQKMVHPVALYLNLRSGARALFCTPDLAGIPAQMGWAGAVVAYALEAGSPEASLARAVAAHLGQPPAVIGIDAARTTKRQLAALAAALPGASFPSADDALASGRLCKTAGEVRLLQAAARGGDRGFVSALNHTEGAVLDPLSYPVWEYAERYRVHVGEFGASAVGNMAVAQGKAARELYPEADPYATFTAGELVRMEYSACYAGYWMSGARTVSTGKPRPAQRRAWAANRRLRAAGLAALRPGSRACDVFAAVAAESAAGDIPFWEAAGVGHGVGTSEHEAPHLAPFDTTPLAPGMVVALAVYSFGPEGELICDKDVFHITAEGPELLTWYKDYSDLYALFGTSARHG